MRHNRLPLVLGSVVTLVLLGSAVWLALGVEAVVRLVPSGSDQLRFQTLTTSEVRFSYRLPRGQTWSGIYDRLTRQGWIIFDDGPRVLWPDQMDDSRMSATFWRPGLLHLVLQWLTVRRDKTDPRMFTIEIIQCIRIVAQARCP
jgi:hypothetical protein